MTHAPSDGDRSTDRAQAGTATTCTAPRTGPPAGSPATVELATTALALAVPFYTALLGWQVRREGTSVTATRDGAPVATLRPADGGPSRWIPVFAVADVPAVRASAGPADSTSADRNGPVDRNGSAGHDGPGGGPDPAMPLVITDDAGCPFGISSATPDVPAHGPGSVAWYEYMSTDPDRSDRFYQEVLGLRAVTSSDGRAEGYRLLVAGDQPVAGRLALPPDLADALRPGWMVCFSCSDVEAATALAADLGGTVTVPPRDTPNGRASAVLDPTGALFTLIRPRNLR